MAILLLRPERDVWQPGEHSGTFRGNNLAFVTAREALTYWEDNALSESVIEKSGLVTTLLNAIVDRFPEAQGTVRGRGLIQGLVLGVPGLAQLVGRLAFERSLVVETSGVEGEVLKVLPPLTISHEELEEGIARIAESLELALTQIGMKSSAAGLS